MIRILATVLAMLLLVIPLSAAETTTMVPATAPDDMLATALLARAGMSRGIVSLPRCGDGQLAMALTRNSQMLVHAMDSNTNNVKALATLAGNAGVLGRSIYVGMGSPAAIPFSENYLNLVIVSDATDGNLAALPPAEILRVLVPDTGKAVIGLAKGTQGNLTRAALDTWLKGCAGATSTIVDDQTGLWAWLTKGAQPGAVAWTHRLFNPSNNRLTTDTAVAWPLMTSWFGKPYQAQEPIVLVANGRMAIIRLLAWGGTAVLDMHDAHNGVLLWQRALPNAAVATRSSGIVLLPDALYLTEGPAVLIFDPATGQEVDRIDCAALGQQVKWLAVQTGIVYTMAGAKEPAVSSSQTWKTASQAPPNFGRCGALGAYRLADKTWRWTQQEPPESIDEGMVGLNDGKLYYYVAGQGLTCRDIATGKVIWQNAKVAERVQQFTIWDGLGGHPGDTRGHIGAIICSDKVLAIHRANVGTLVVSAASGDILWDTKTADVLFDQDILLKKGGAGGSCVDSLTGKATTSDLSKVNLGSGCGSFTLAGNFVCGQMGVTYNLKDKQSLEYNGCGPLFHKTPCLTGTFVGDGLLIFPDGACSCDYYVRGMVVQASAPAPRDGGTQLTPSTRATAAILPFAVDDRDWPTFRGSVTRANASRTTVSDTPPVVKWTWTPTAPPSAQVDTFTNMGPVPLESAHEPVQASCAGGLVFAISTDGAVNALEQTTGAIKWRFATESHIFTPPTIADDRCYVGSGDGIVYCLEAATGRELWRYRVAPNARLMMVYGNLESTWPVTGGVLVEKGVAYVIAGNLDVDGTYVAALDAKTGAVKWRNDTSGQLNAQRGTGVSGCGYPTIAKGRLWLRTASYDLVTGECRPMLQPAPAKITAADIEKTRGILLRYTGLFADKFLVFGGRRFFADQSVGQVSQTRDRGDLYFAVLSDDGASKLPIYAPWANCRTMPSWDEKTLIAMPTVYNSKYDRSRDEDLVCWDVPKAVGELTKTMDDAAGKTPVPGSVQAKTLDRAKDEKFEAPQQLWTANAEWFVASVLSANAIVATYASHPEGNYRPFRDVPTADKLPYKLSAYSRTDGAVLWTLPLPGQPLMDGVSITRDGNIIVQMLDGSVLCVGR